MTDKERDERIERLENVLGTLISWMGQTAGSPIAPSEAATLLDRLNQLGRI